MQQQEPKQLKKIYKLIQIKHKKKYFILFNSDRY